MKHTHATYTYLVVIEHLDVPTGTLYGASVPDIPGCTAIGKALDAVLADIRRSLHKIFVRRLQDGAVLPRANTLETLQTEYAHIGEEVIPPKALVLTIEVLCEVVVAVPEITVAVAA